jgi:hypothetical protein
MGDAVILLQAALCCDASGVFCSNLSGNIGVFQSSSLRTLPLVYQFSKRTHIQDLLSIESGGRARLQDSLKTLNGGVARGQATPSSPARAAASTFRSPTRPRCTRACRTC